jgi:uncharacterized protein
MPDDDFTIDRDLARVVLRDYLSAKASTLKHEPRLKLKIVIAGPLGAGVSAFVRTASQINAGLGNNEHTEGAPPSKHSVRVQYDFGRITLSDNLSVTLFGMPPGEAFEYVRAIQAVGMSAFAVLMDSAKPELADEVRSLWAELMGYAPVPSILIANKQDLTAARSVDELGMILGLGDEVGLEPCIATNVDSVDSVIMTLLKALLRYYERPETGQAR